MAVTTALPTAPGGGVNADILNAVRSGAADNTNVLKAAGIGSGTSKFRIPDAMVKGTRAPGEKPLDDFDQVMTRQTYAEKSFLASIQKTMSDPASVIEGMNPDSPLRGPLGMLLKNNPMFQMAQAIKNIDKSFQLASPLSQGLLPYDLSAPTMLIYPVYSPLRNRFPRPAGQGKSHEATSPHYDPRFAAWAVRKLQFVRRNFGTSRRWGHYRSQLAEPAACLWIADRSRRQYRLQILRIDRSGHVVGTICRPGIRRYCRFGEPRLIARVYACRGAHHCWCNGLRIEPHDDRHGHRPRRRLPVRRPSQATRKAASAST